MRFAFLLNKPVPGPLRSVGIQALCGTFALTFDVEAPDVVGLSPDRALHAFREFSAACMEEALVSPPYAVQRRAELERQARRLGAKVRAALQPSNDELAALVRALYAVIEIDVDGEVPGVLVFHRCSFACRYTPELCAFMGAFDSGFVGGLCAAGDLTFSQRITEGAPCCRAWLAASIGAYGEYGDACGRSDTR